MVLYGVENHYMITGDSDVTRLFHTRDEAMAYLMQKFDENANEDGLVCSEVSFKHENDEYMDKDTARKIGGFYHDCDEAGIDHYRIVKYEIPDAPKKSLYNLLNLVHFYYCSSKHKEGAYDLFDEEDDYFMSTFKTATEAIIEVSGHLETFLANGSGNDSKDALVREALGHPEHFEID